MNQPVTPAPVPPPVAPAFYSQSASPVSKAVKPPVYGNAKDKIFAFLFLICNIAFFDCLLYGELNLGFTVVCTVFFVLLTAYLSDKGTSFQLYPFVCGLLAVAGGVPFALHTDGFIRFVLFFTVVGLFVLYGIYYSGNGRFSSGGFRSTFDVIKHIFAYPFRFIGAACGGLFGRNPQSEQAPRKSLGKILLGIICTLPVLAVVLPLMVRSNVYFEKLLSGISIDVARLIVCMILGFLTIPFLLSLIFAWKKGLAKADTKPTPIGGSIDSIIVHSFLWVMAAVDLIYLLTQTAYFFSAFAGQLPDKEYAQTAADYARRGFFEMCAIAAIHLLILFFVMLLIRKKERQFPLTAKLLGGFMCLFTILLIGTALSKMFLYIERFGLTRLRVATSLFMIFLVFVFIAVAIRLFVRRFPYMKLIVVTFSAILLLTAYCDIDTVVARYNVEAYQSGKLETIDVETLSELSDGAVPYLARLLDEASPEVYAAAHDALVDRLFDLYKVECSCDYFSCDYAEPMGHYHSIHSCDYRCDGVSAITPYLDPEDLSTYNRDRLAAQQILEQHFDQLLVSVPTGSRPIDRWF